MTKPRHGKIPDWYNQSCDLEHAFNDESENSIITNKSIEMLLKKHKVKTVLDLTCGTGSQVFWLLKHGYDVTGSDISYGMLNIAKNKAREEKIKVKLLLGDMRTTKVGHFDAVITIFNAIGHLSKTGFEKTMRNIHKNLNNDGIYIFDILNLSYVMNDDNICKLSYEQVKTKGNIKYRIMQHSTIDSSGILISYTTTYVQKGTGKLKRMDNVDTLQLYTAQELSVMLVRNGYKVLGQYGIDGSKFSDKKSERILMVAKRQNKY